MFKNRKRQMDNTAAASINLPRPASSPTIHNHAPSEAGKIFAWALVVFIGLVVAWFFILYLISEMGYRNPVRVMGWVLVGVSSLILVTVAVDRTITKMYGMKREYDLRLEEIRADRDRSLALTAAQPRPGESRLTGEDSKFAALLSIVMSEAYRHLDEAGQYAKSDVKPWSRTPNQGRQIPGFKDVVTFKMAGDVRQWLTQEGVIKRDEVNLERYPSFAHFEKLLEAEFYTPIQVNKALSPALRQEVSFIDN
jgi:hypothetical protein